MYETVKTIGKYNIKKMAGTKGCYHVTLREGEGFKISRTFRTIKSATEFVETL